MLALNMEVSLYLIPRVAPKALAASPTNVAGPDCQTDNWYIAHDPCPSSRAALMRPIRCNRSFDTSTDKSIRVLAFMYLLPIPWAVPLNRSGR